jgi:predicted nucleic acid-binding protein
VKPFADTNVVICALVPDDAHRQLIAQQRLAGLRGPRPAITTQVLAETFRVLTRRKGWKPADANKALRVLAELTVVVPSAESVLQGLALAARHRLSGWGALLGGCDTLYTEDLQPGQRFGARQVVNPFDRSAHEAPPTATRTRRRR